MLKIPYDPNAYLTGKRNVRLGLVARTKILKAIEKKTSNVMGIEEASGLKYAVVLYHLKLLESEGIAQRGGQKRPFFWSLTGVGQRRLVEG